MKKKKIRRGFLKMFLCVMGALFCGAYAYWAIFELKVPEFETIASVLRLMSIFVAVIIGGACILGALLWMVYLKDQKTK